MIQLQNTFSWKEPLEVIESEHPAPNRATLGCSGPVQASFEELKEQRNHNLSGQPVPVLNNNLITVYKVQGNYPLHFIFCPYMWFHVLPDQCKPHLGPVHSASVPRSQGTVFLWFPLVYKRTHLWQTLVGPIHRGNTVYPSISIQTLKYKCLRNMLWNKALGDHAEHTSVENTHIHIHTGKTQIRKMFNTYINHTCIELHLHK